MQHGFHRFLDFLATIPDPRRAEGKRYEQRFVLLFAILAIITGANSYRGNGERITCSTGATKKEDAERFARKYEDDLPDGGETVSFAYVAQAYIDWRNPKEPDATYITRLVGVLGGKNVREITHADLVQAADILLGGRTAATATGPC